MNDVMIKKIWLPKPELFTLWGLWIACALGILWLANATSLDLVLADQYYDFVHHGFMLKHAFLYETVLHLYAKHALTVLWIGLLLLACLPAGLFKGRISAATRYKLRWVVLIAAINAIAVSSLKHQMPHACPWDVTRYGGSVPWVPTFSAHPAVEAGHCFPAGHATSGLWLAALGLLWLPQAPRKALLVTLAGLAVGFGLGWAQQIRGAHFLSHTLSSVWLMCGWLLLVITFSKSRIE